MLFYFIISFILFLSLLLLCITLMMVVAKMEWIEVVLAEIILKDKGIVDNSLMVDGDVINTFNIIINHFFNTIFCMMCIVSSSSSTLSSLKLE